MSDFVFDPTKQYGHPAACNDMVDVEFVKRALSKAAHEVVPEQYRDRITYGITPMMREIDYEYMDAGAACWVWWKYTPLYVMLNDDWPIRIEVSEDGKL